MTIELTEIDKRNGWTAETLEEYHKEREKENSNIDKYFKKSQKPSMQTTYNPLKWR